MNKDELGYLLRSIDRIEVDNIYEAFNEIRSVLRKITEHLMENLDGRVD